MGTLWQFPFFVIEFGPSNLGPSALLWPGLPTVFGQTAAPVRPAKSVTRPPMHPSALPASNPPAPEQSADQVADQFVDLLARRRLLAPAALFVLGHRPLAFVAGQMILLLDPVAGLLGFAAWDRWAGPWANLLSRPDGPDRLAAMLIESRGERET